MLWLLLACGHEPAGTDPTGGPMGTDADGDGVAAPQDCDDADPARFPGAVEVWYDGVDQDCGGGDDLDQDADGDRRPIDGGMDCDDVDPGVSSLVIVNADMARSNLPGEGAPLEQRFDRSPVAPVSPLDASDNQHHTTVTWTDGDRVAAAWQSGSEGQYVALLSLFDDAGAQLPGFPVLVNDPDTKGGKPDVESRGSRGTLVAYEGGTDPIYLRGFDVDGVPLGDPQLVFEDATPGVLSETPDLALFDDGSGVVVWESNGGAHGEGIHYVQRFDADLQLVDAPRFIKAAGRSAADIVALPGAPGGYVVTGTYKETSTDLMQVYAVKVGADGCWQEIRGDQGESDAPSRPAIAVDGAGRMAITWRSKVEQGLGEGSYGRFFEASGRARSDSFPLAMAKEDGNRSVVAFWGSDVVFVWQGIVAGEREDVAASIWNIDSVSQVFAEDILNEYGDEPEIDAQRPSIAIRQDAGGAATLVVTWESEQLDPTSVFSRFVNLEVP